MATRRRMSPPQRKRGSAPKTPRCPGRGRGPRRGAGPMKGNNSSRRYACGGRSK